MKRYINVTNKLGGSLFNINYPQIVIFNLYRRIYGEGYIFFYYGASVPWVMSVNNFRVFSNISETIQPTDMQK